MNWMTSNCLYIRMYVNEGHSGLWQGNSWLVIRIVIFGHFLVGLTNDSNFSLISLFSNAPTTLSPEYTTKSMKRKQIVNQGIESGSPPPWTYEFRGMVLRPSQKILIQNYNWVYSWSRKGLAQRNRCFPVDKRKRNRFHSDPNSLVLLRLANDLRLDVQDSQFYCIWTPSFHNPSFQTTDRAMRWKAKRIINKIVLLGMGLLILGQNTYMKWFGFHE